jgi:DNA topoisomerase-1
MDDKPVTVAIGRFGPFAKRGDTYASLGKEDDPYKISFERAVELIRAKEEMIANRTIKTFEGTDIQVLNGRYGPYITDGEKNGKIPKDRDPASLTQAECEALLAEGKPVRKGGRFGKKKVAAKKAPAKKAAVKKTSDKAAAPAKKAAKKATKKTAKKATKKTTAKKAAKKAVKKAAAKAD